jgi:hypothetical protein
MGDRVRGHRLRIGATAGFIAPRCNNRGGKVVGPSKHCKNVPPQLLARRTLYIAGYGNRIQNGPHDY